MAASALPSGSSSLRPDASSSFLAVLPRMASYARHSFRHLPPGDRAEAVAETIAAAYVLTHGLHQRRRSEVIGSPGFFQYAVLHAQSDRHVGGSASSTDVCSRLARQRRGFRLQSFYLPNRDAGWREFAVEDRRCGPAETAAFKVDFETWLQGQSRRNRCIIDLLAAGERASAIADRFGISQPRICQLRQQFAEDWLRFQGEGPFVPRTPSGGVRRWRIPSWDHRMPGQPLALMV